jgi:hypothetical protein
MASQRKMLRFSEKLLIDALRALCGRHLVVPIALPKYTIVHEVVRWLLFLTAGSNTDVFLQKYWPWCRALEMMSKLLDMWPLDLPR